MLLQSLPLFPLGSVLFPGGVLPLRVFEVRYLDMVRKCIDNNAPFGIVALKAGTEVRQPEQNEVLWDVGTIATVDTHSAPQPGLMVIRCKGQQRFRITRRERMTHGLWVADVERIDDDTTVAVPPDLKPAADALHSVVMNLLLRGTPEAELPLTMPLQLSDSGWIANRWCELLPLPLELKQRLMELDNPLLRLELIGDILRKQKILT
jgi:uncharacterized protein